MTWECIATAVSEPDPERSRAAAAEAAQSWVHLIASLVEVGAATGHLAGSSYKQVAASAVVLALDPLGERDRYCVQSAMFEELQGEPPAETDPRVVAAGTRLIDYFSTEQDRRSDGQYLRTALIELAEDDRTFS